MTAAPGDPDRSRRTLTAGSVDAPARGRTASSTDDQAASPDRTRWLEAGLPILALALSIIGSSRVSLWTDEAATISGADRTLGDLFRMAQNIDVVHSTYYAFMHLWTGWFGISPFALRLPSAIAIALATWGVYRLGLRLGGRAVAAVGAAVFVVLPRVTWLGIEARPYAFTVAAAVWATVVVIGAVSTGDRRRWIGYALLVALGVALNIYLALLPLAHLVSILLQPQRRAGTTVRFLIAAAAGGLLASPIVLEALGQTGQLGDGAFGWGALVQNVVVNQWFLGDTPTTTTGVSTTSLSLTDPGSWWKPSAIALAAVGWLLVGLGLWDASRRRGAERAMWWRWLLPWIVLPTAIIGLYSVLISPMYSPRYLSFAAPAVAIAIAYGILALRHRWLQWVAGALVVVLCVPVFLGQRQLYGKNGSDWVSVAEFVDHHRQPGQAVYFAPRYPDAPGPIGQSTRGIRVAYPAAFDGLTDLTLVESAAAAANLTGYSKLLTVGELRGQPAVWVVRRLDYPAHHRDRDDTVLRDAGFRPDLSWSGPLDEVILFVSE